MSHDWSTHPGSFQVVERQRDLLALGQELRLARQFRAPRPVRRRLGRLLIAAGAALYGPALDATGSESTLAIARKR